MRKIICILLLILGSVSSTYGQVITFPADKNISVNNIQPIIFGKEVTGYYAIYMYEQNQKYSVWNVVIMNANFKIIREFIIEAKLNVGFRSSSFNGEVFCFLFGNEFSDIIQQFIFSKEGDFIAKGDIEYFKKTSISSLDLYDISGIPYAGFIKNSLNEEGELNIEMINNEGDILWKIEPQEILVDGKKRAKEILNYYYSDTNYLVLRVQLTKMEERSLRDGRNHELRIYSIKTGKEIFSLDRRHDKGYLFPLGIQSDQNGLTLYGQYFDYTPDKSEYDVEKNLGFYCLTADLNGQISSEKFNSWIEDMSGFIGFNELVLKTGNKNIWNHKMIRTVSGNYYAISEIYFKGKSKYFHIGDLILVEMDPELEVLNVYSYEKNKSNDSKSKPGREVWIKYLPLMNKYEVGQFLLAYGAMDFVYYTQSLDKNIFSIVYKYYKQVDKQTRNYIVGSVALDREGVIVNPKITLSDKPDNIAVIPAKIGYVAIVEYFRKGNFATLTLHKLDM